MENKNSNSTKQVLLSVLAVAILVVAVVGVSFAFFTYSKQGTTENTISTGTLVFKYNEPTAGISLTDAVPMSDEDAKNELVGSGKSFDFTVTSTIKGSTVIGYEINAIDATTVEEGNKLESKYVKVRLSQGTSDDGTYATEVLAPTHFSTLTASTRTTGAYVLGNGTVTGSDAGTETTHYYRLQMWLADTDADGKTTMMENDYCQDAEGTRVECTETLPEGVTLVKGTNDKTFTIKVNVDAKDQG